MSKKTMVFRVLLSIFVIGVISGKYGGRYDAAKDDFDYRRPMGSHGPCLRNSGTAICLMEDFVRSIFTATLRSLAVVTIDYVG